MYIQYRFIVILSILSISLCVSKGWATELKDENLYESFIAFGTPRNVMDPLIPYEKGFKYDGMSVTQVTPLSLKFVDGEFAQQTKGGIQRAVGTAELMAVVYAHLDGEDLSQATERRKQSIAKNTILSLLKDDEQVEYLAKGTLSVPTLDRIYKELKEKLFAKIGLCENQLMSAEDYLNGEETFLPQTIVKIDLAPSSLREEDFIMINNERDPLNKPFNIEERSSGFKLIRYLKFW